MTRMYMIDVQPLRFLGIPALIMAFTGCTRQPVELPLTSTEEPSAVHEKATSEGNEPSAEVIQVEIPEEPDWKAEFGRLKGTYHAAFTSVEPGSDVEIQTLSGILKSGELDSVDDGMIMLKIVGGSVGYSRMDLSSETRLRFFAEDYALFHAKQGIKKQRSEYAELVEAAKRKQALYETYKVRSGDTTHRKPVPIVDSRDGSVLQVKQFIESNSRNSDSIKYLSWSEIRRHREGYIVECTYEIDSGSFGTATERKFFIMNGKGRVIRAAPVRDVRT